MLSRRISDPGLDYWYGELTSIMKRCAAISLLIFTGSTLAPCREFDWAKLFQDAVVRDPATNDHARDQFFNQIMPKLLNEELSLAAEEIPGIVVQLNREDDGIRVQASAVLSVLAQLRPDSATVLSQAFPALMDRVQDSVPRIRINSLNALCYLRPGIPAEEIQFLIRMMDNRDELLASRATFGVARMASLRADADDAMDSALSQTDSPNRRLAAIRAMLPAHVTSPRLVSRLGGLLGDKDTEVIRAALQAIQELGIPAITANLNQLNQLAETSGDKEVTDLARQLIERQSSIHSQ